MVDSKTIATMKNLFKNLMLVAVAAMAFTACSEDNNEVNNVERVTRYEFTAEIADDTRSGFVEKEDGATAYKSEWAGNETLKIFVTDYNGYYVETTAKIDDEGKFTLELENAPANLFMKVCSPAESWTGENSVNIPAVQNPTALSVDPMAHILATTGFVSVQNGVADKITMAHNDAAYGKMTVNADDFAIDHVVVDLKGSFYGSSRELSYTINAANVEGNTFWFATEPIDVTEFTVTAYDAEGSAIAKTVDMTNVEKPLSFKYGHVSTFSVSELEEPAAPMFTSAAYNNNPGDKVVKLYSDTLGELWINFYGNNHPLITSDNCINPGTYGIGNGMYFGGNYGQYKPVGHEYFITSTPKAFTLDVSIVNGMYKFVINADYTNSYDGVILENATFIGTIPGLDIPDTRTKLSTPDLSYVTDGMKATISWERVEGAVGYRVHTYYNEINTTITETSITLDFAESGYGTYYIYVGAIAAEDNADFKNSDEDHVVITFEDPRSILPAPTNLAVAVDGANATITWDKVVGADYYSVSYYLNGNQIFEVTEESFTFEPGFNRKNLWVYVKAMANEDNANYRSSDTDASVVVNTDRDPNALADYVFDETFVWDASGYFLLTDSTFGSSTYWRIYLNAADRPGNNSIKEGTYYGENGTSNPSVGHFCTRMGADSTAPFWYFYQSYVQSSWTLDVKVVNGEYQIVMDAGDYGTFGYKGLPDDFVLPSEGEGGGDDNTGDEGDGAIQMTKLYYRESAANVHNYVMENADGSCKFTITLNKDDATTTWIPVYTYQSKSTAAVNGNTGYFSLQYDSAIINGTSYQMNAAGHTLKVISSSNGGNHEIELTAVTSGGVEYKFVYSGVITTL